MIKPEEILIKRINQLLYNITASYSIILPEKYKPSTILRRCISRKVSEWLLYNSIQTYTLSEQKISKLLKESIPKKQLESFLEEYKNKIVNFDNYEINLSKLSPSQLDTSIDLKTAEETLEELIPKITDNNYDTLKVIVEKSTNYFVDDNFRLDFLDYLFETLLKHNFRIAINNARDKLANESNKTITDNEIANAINISGSSFNEYANANSLPLVKNLVKITKFFDLQSGDENRISYDYLLGNIHKANHELESLYKDFGLSEDAIKILKLAKDTPLIPYTAIIQTINQLICNLYISTPVRSHMVNYLDFSEEQDIIDDLKEKAKEIELNDNIPIKSSPDNKYTFKVHNGIKVIYMPQKFKQIQNAKAKIKIMANDTTICNVNDTTITINQEYTLVERNGYSNYIYHKYPDFRYTKQGSKDSDVLSALTRYFNNTPADDIIFSMDKNYYIDFETDLRTSETPEEAYEIIESFINENKHYKTYIDSDSIHMIDLQRKIEILKSKLL